MTGHSLIDLLIVGIVVGALFYIVDHIEWIPPLFKMVAKVIAGVILLIMPIDCRSHSHHSPGGAGKR